MEEIRAEQLEEENLTANTGALCWLTQACVKPKNMQRAAGQTHLDMLTRPKLCASQLLYHGSEYNRAILKFRRVTLGFDGSRERRTLNSFKHTYPLNPPSWL